MNHLILLIIFLSRMIKQNPPMAVKKKMATQPSFHVIFLSSLYSCKEIIPYYLKKYLSIKNKANIRLVFLCIRSEKYYLCSFTCPNWREDIFVIRIQSSPCTRKFFINYFFVNIIHTISQT
jgi:hypothetical protein